MLIWTAHSLVLHVLQTNWPSHWHFIRICLCILELCRWICSLCEWIPLIPVFAYCLRLETPFGFHFIECFHHLVLLQISLFPHFSPHLQQVLPFLSNLIRSHIIRLNLLKHFVSLILLYLLYPLYCFSPVQSLYVFYLVLHLELLFLLFLCQFHFIVQLHSLIHDTLLPWIFNMYHVVQHTSPVLVFIHLFNSFSFPFFLCLCILHSLFLFLSHLRPNKLILPLLFYLFILLLY
jgi:hypothetical protein